MKIKKLSLNYFSSKLSWSSNENFKNLQKYPHSIDVRNLDSFDRILVKPQFVDLEHLTLITDYAMKKVEPLRMSELDVSKFEKLKSLELFGCYIKLKEDQQCDTLTHLSIEYVNVDLIEIFPNLIYLKTNCLNSNQSSFNLKHLELFDYERDVTLNQVDLFKLCPNLQILSCYFLNAYALLCRIEKEDDLLLKRLSTIRVYFNNFISHESLIDFIILKAKNLKLNVEIHINENKDKQKGELIRWNKFFQRRQIYRFYYGERAVNLQEFFNLPNYENNTLLRQHLKVDNHSLQNINDSVYQYLFNTSCLELNCGNLEVKFNHLLQTIPSITKLIINYRLEQITFDKFKLHCPYLEYIEITSKQAYKLDLNFINYLDHLKSINFKNLDLLNSSSIGNKVKFSKFLHDLRFKNCLLDIDYSLIFKSMIEKARKNPGKYYLNEIFLKINSNSLLLSN